LAGHVSSLCNGSKKTAIKNDMETRMSRRMLSLHSKERLHEADSSRHSCESGGSASGCNGPSALLAEFQQKGIGAQCEMTTEKIKQRIPCFTRSCCSSGMLPRLGV